MRIDGIRTLAGPNIYTYRPALLMRLDLEDLCERESREFAGFNECLLKRLPGLNTHHCAKARPGGFVERLREGTYFGHIVEHVALELTDLAGVPVTHGKTRAADEPCIYNVVVEFKAEAGTRFLLEAAVALVESVLRHEPYPLEETLAEARRLIARTELGPTTRAIVDAAQARGIPWRRVSEGGSLVQLGYGKQRRLIQAAMSEGTSIIATEIASDKDFAKQLLTDAAVAVPRGIVVRTEAEALKAFKEIGPPVVIKPLDGRQGQGVVLDVRTEQEASAGFRAACVYSEHVLVEEQFAGRNYRVLVVGGRAVAASERFPCQIVGDGRHTVAELIERENRNPLRGEGHEKPMTQIMVDEIVLAHLRKVGLELSSVPDAGRTVILRESINLSTGGSAVDVTDEMHPGIARLCERAARAIGLDICGVDLVVPDIAQAPPARGGGVIELNASPGLRMHLFPSAGARREVGRAIVDLLYPAGAQEGRVPLITITGTNGKTTVTRMIAHACAAAGACVGMTTTDGIYIDGELIAAGDTTGPHSARTVLSDPSVEVAVLETARGGIMRRGLGYDWSDVAVLTNIQPDHFGQDGIESLDDLVHVKSLVAECVRAGGTLVLNADDELLARLPESERVRRIERRIVYFSLRDNHVLIKRHAGAGGTCYFVRDGWVVECVGPTEQRVVELARVPATLGGAADFQVANVLAATAACRAHGLGVEQIAAALATFDAAAHNPGRFNLYRLASGGHLLLDYGHNPEALRAVSQMAARWRGRGVTGIVGVPGDRSDELIVEAGRIAARGFDRLIIKEDEDLRGRAPGEVARLLCTAVREIAPERECSVVPDEVDALRQALAGQRAGEIVVMFYDKLAALSPVLTEYGATPVSTLGEPPLAQAATASAAATGATADATADGRDGHTTAPPPRAPGQTPPRPQADHRRACAGWSYAWR